MELWEELNVRSAQLDQSIKSLYNTGKAYAKAEMEYKVLLRQEILKLRDQGVAVGVIDKICYGIPSVAEKRFLRDIAESTYKANLEAINSIKLQIRLIDNQMSREWTNTNDR